MSNASFKVGVAVQTTMLDVPTLERTLFDDERRIVKKYADDGLTRIRAKWVGWKYEGRPESKRGRSYGGWKRRVQTVQVPFSISWLNEALDYYKGKPYVAYVHRSGQAVKEYSVVFSMLDTDVVLPLTDELRVAIQKNLTTPGPARKLRTNRETTTDTATFT